MVPFLTNIATNHGLSGICIEWFTANAIELGRILIGGMTVDMRCGCEWFGKIQLDNWVLSRGCVEYPRVDSGIEAMMRSQTKLKITENVEN